MNARPAQAQTPAPVSGDPAPVRDAARARLVEGVELLRLGQYAPALAKFEQAYALVPSANIHYDRGLAYVGLGRNGEALEAFDAFLSQADHPPPGSRDAAERHRQRLRTRVATLEVTSDPAGAGVTVDGRRYGVALAGRPIYVDPGSHEVAARDVVTGAEAASQRITALAGQTIKITLRLGAREMRARGDGLGGAAPAATALSSVPVAPDSHELRGSDAPEPRRASDIRFWSLSAAGLGVALIGAGATFGLLVDREENRVAADAKSSTPPHMTIEFDGAPRTSESHALTYQTFEAVFLATGAAALATGIILYAVKRRTEHRAGGATSAWHRGSMLGGGPILAPAAAGARVQLSF